LGSKLQALDLFCLRPRTEPYLYLDPLVSAKAGELKESRNGGKTRGREEKKNGR
jgi:hypothetical protein